MELIKNRLGSLANAFPQKIFAVICIVTGLAMAGIAGTAILDEATADVLVPDEVCNLNLGGSPGRSVFCTVSEGCFSGPVTYLGVTYGSKYVEEIDYWYCKSSLSNDCWWETTGSWWFNWEFDTVPCVVIYYYFNTTCTDPPNKDQYLGGTYVCDSTPPP